jgi:hypothetical protein
MSGLLERHRASKITITIPPTHIVPRSRLNVLGSAEAVYRVGSLQSKSLLVGSIPVVSICSSSISKICETDKNQTVL